MVNEDKNEREQARLQNDCFEGNREKEVLPASSEKLPKEELPLRVCLSCGYSTPEAVSITQISLKSSKPKQLCSLICAGERLTAVVAVSVVPYLPWFAVPRR